MKKAATNKRIKIGILLFLFGGAFYYLSFFLNDWLIRTMPRHQLIQLPGMLGIGILFAAFFPHLNIKNPSHSLAAFFLIMSSLIFWMLPRSIDLAVLSPSFNRIMHLNMVIIGFLFAITIRKVIFELKIAFLGMIGAMLIVVGTTLRIFDILLCSSFNIGQQQETGFYILLAGLAVFVTTIVLFFSGLSAPKSPPAEEVGLT